MLQILKSLTIHQPYPFERVSWGQNKTNWWRLPQDFFPHWLEHLRISWEPSIFILSATERDTDICSVTFPSAFANLILFRGKRVQGHLSHYINSTADVLQFCMILTFSTASKTQYVHILVEHL